MSTSAQAPQVETAAASARALLVDVCEIEQARRLVDALEPTESRASREELLELVRAFGNRALLALAADRLVPAPEPTIASPTPSATTPTSRSDHDG